MTDGNFKAGDIIAACDSHFGQTLIAISAVKEVEKNGCPKGEFIKWLSISHSDDSVFDHPALIRLIHESHSVFTRIQKEGRTANFSVSDIISFSLQYRSIIRAAKDSLEDSDAVLKDTLLFADTIWSLVETIFMKSQDSSVVVDLIKWARTSLVRAPFLEKVSQKHLMTEWKNMSDDDFWLQVIYFVLSGMFVNASDLLRAYANASNDEILQDLAKVISEIDIELLNDPSSQQDFIAFQRELNDSITAGRFGPSDSNACLVAKIIGGNRDALSLACNVFECWYEIMPAFLLFLRPTATLSQLGDLVEECSDIFGGEKNGGTDEIMRALFSLDALHVMHHILLLSSDWWLAAHLSDLLQKADPRLMVAVGVDVRQNIIIEYATSLFKNKRMWQVSADYFRECGDEGLSTLEALLANMCCSDEMTLIKVIRLCNELNFDELGVTLKQAAAYECLRRKEWNNALSWAIHSKDSELTTEVVEHILALCPHETVSSLIALDQADELSLDVPSLLFLLKYYKFLQRLSAGDDENTAARLLVELITSEYAPREYYPELFKDLLDILVCSSQAVLNKDETYTVIQFIESFDSSGLFGAELSMFEDIGDILMSLRNALLNNLCDAISVH
ncbi:hypothetical protein AB6A40_001542 [Gnathostoma spinigerum]|uniref:Nuclear pore complex protein Nup85 n=1 Tax=Gnathostoma spinigerum TaxID=75299 RepID=A0ABD6EDB5_9BILA